MAAAKKVFSKLAKEIKARKDLVDRSVYLPPKAGKAVLAQAEAERGGPLPEAIQALYAQADGFALSWQVQDPDKPNRVIEGHVQLTRLAYLFTGQVVTYAQGKATTGLYWQETLPAEKVDFFREAYVLDDLRYGDYVLFTLPPGTKAPTLYLLLYPDRVYPLTISLDDYIDLLGVTRGLDSWQRYVTDPASDALDAEIPDHFHQHLQHLFPKATLAPFRPPPEPVASIYNTFLAREDKIDYRARFEERVAAMKASGRFKRITFEPNPGVPVGVLRKVRAALGRELPESLLSFYYQMNGCRLRWTLAEPGADGPVKGRIDLLPLEEVFGGEGGVRAKTWDASVYENILWMTDHDEALQARLRPLKLLERIEGASYDVVLRLDDGQDEPQLFLKDKTDLVPLRVDFPAYLDALLDAMGLTYWQFFVTEPGAGDPAERVPAFPASLNAAFPDASASTFRLKG